MPCKKCQTNPVIYYPGNNVKLCKSCFTKYFEKKALKTIRGFNLINKKDKIGVAVSGGKDSLTTLYILNKLAKKRKNLNIIAILIDEGIKGYRNFTIKDAQKFCKEHKIKLKIFSYKKEFDYTLDQMVKRLNKKPCSICGVFRRLLLNKKARELGVNKLATGHNLDDEAQSILMNQFKRNTSTSMRMGPKTGVEKHNLFIPRIKPLYLLTEKEVMTYAFLKGFNIKYTNCPYAPEAFRNNVRDLLNKLEEKHPGSKHGLIQSFLEILPLLKSNYISDKKIKLCSQCQEPSSKETCQSCETLKLLKQKHLNISFTSD